MAADALPPLNYAKAAVVQDAWHSGMRLIS